MAGLGNDICILANNYIILITAMISEQQANEVMGPSESLKARVPLNLPDVISGGKHQFHIPP